MRSGWLILCMFAISFFFGCMNQYEKQVIGDYEVGEYELIDSFKISKNILPHLTLNNNHTFSLKFVDSTKTGKWKADDYSDFTLIDFWTGENKSQGKVIGTELQPEIEISIPSNFYCPFLKTLIFKRMLK